MNANAATANALENAKNGKERCGQVVVAASRPAALVGRETTVRDGLK